MRNFKFLATTLVAVMLACVLAFASFAATTPFTDVDDKKNEALSDAVSLLNGLGVAKGTSETTFGTMDLVTREQMAAFVYRLMKEGKSVEGGSNSTPFTDLEDSTYFSYISWANGLGIIKGTSATTFNPKGGITLQDAYTMIIRALGHEDDKYVYPFTYIDKAEELGLDEGLDSAVNYTTKLTRGEVAVVLYNTFFAETGKEEKIQVERKIGNGSKWVLEEKIVNPTLAEDVYNVEVGNFEVRATPKYAFNEDEDSTDYIPLCDEYDVDMLHLVAAEANEPLAEIYCEFADTGLSGAADDYIMRGIKAFYTYEEKNGTKKLDKVYFMTSDHSVIETNSAAFKYVTVRNAADTYYDYINNRYNSNKRPKAEGYLTVGKNTIFFFDAPYNYLKPTYTPDMSEGERYDLRNEKNVKLIDIKCLDTEKGTYSYYIDTAKPVDTAEDMVANLTRVFSNGVYKMKFFDIDGDGVYEYCHYMPATYGFMDGDDGKYFASDMENNAPVFETLKGGSDLDLSFAPTIYYNEANISGVKFEDGDLVIAYLNPDANIIDVSAVVKPYRGAISKIMNSAMIRMDSTNFIAYHSYKLVEGFKDCDTYYAAYNSTQSYEKPYYGHSSVFSSICTRNVTVEANVLGEVFDIYAYNNGSLGNAILWYDHVEDAEVSFALDELAIPVSNEDNKAETLTKSKFDAEIGDAVYYAQVYFNGKVSYIPLDVEEMYPALDAAYADGEFNLSEVTGQDGYMAYVDKICKIKKGSDGLYTLIPLLHAEDDEEEYVGVNRDSTVLVEDDNNDQFGNDLDVDHPGYIKKIAGNRYALLEDPDDMATTLLGDPYDENGETIKYFNLTGSTRIIIKNTVGDNVEYLEFDQTTFKGTVASELTNIQYVLTADPESKTQAKLVLLYAEAEDFEFETKGIKNGWRVVLDSEIVKNEDGDFGYSYKLFNPYTGAIEENVAGKATEAKVKDLDEAVANGTIIEIKASVVDEEADTAGTIDTSASAGLVYLTEYDAEEGYIGFVPVEAIENDICCGEDLKTFVEEFVYYGDEMAVDGEEFKVMVDGDDEPVYGKGLYYQVTADTVITVLTSEKAGADAVTKGEFKVSDIDSIAKGSKEFKCYNDKVLNRKGNYGTEYAEYVKAYIYSSDNADREDELPVAEYIVVVVNGGEEMIFTDYDENFYPATHE